MDEKVLNLKENRQLSSEQIRQIVNKEKKSWIIATVFIAFCCCILLAGTIVIFIFEESSLGIFALLLFYIAILFYFIRTYKIRNDREWVLSYAKGKKMDVINIEMELLKREKFIDNDFDLSKKVNILASGWSSANLLVDNLNKKFVYQKGKTYSKTYNFSDIINFEVFENDKSQVLGSPNSALIGDYFFSLDNFIAEISSNSNINEKSKQLKLIIRLKDIDCPQIIITYVENWNLIKSGKWYRDIKENLQTVCSILEQMINCTTLNIHEEVLNMFYYNKLLLHKEFVPIIKQAKELNLSDSAIANYIYNAYELCESQVKSTDNLGTSEAKVFQAKIEFLKIFVCEKCLHIIEKNEKLLKLLTNAFFKYKNIDLMVENTYEIFLELSQISFYNFSKPLYKSLITVFVSTKESCNEFYEGEELVLDFDTKELSINECIDKIIEDKSYKNYEIDKLVLSVLYEKSSSFSNIEEFIKEYGRLPYYIKKIKNVVLREDLLNNEYQNRKTSIVDIDLMSGIEFEEFLCNYFKSHGYECSMTKATGDQGVDLIAKRDGTVVAIQAKCYSGTVGNHAIMEAVAGSRFYNANQCMVITNSTFTKTAIELARANNVILWDRKTLIEKI